MNQHELVVRVLCEAGGQAVETAVPAGYTGKLADVLFASDDVIVEVKSLTTDRAAAPSTARLVGDMFSKSRHLNAPVIFGSVSMNLNDLDPRVAANTLRIIGKRVLDEAKSANKQLKATKAILHRPNALGVVALVTPPFKLDRKTIVWTMGDAMRDGRCSAIDVLFLIETPLAAVVGDQHAGNSFLSLHSRGERTLPPHLLVAIDRAWGHLTGQDRQHADADDFHKYGATS